MLLSSVGKISSVLTDLTIMAIKTGMLFDAENTRAVVRALKSHYFKSGSFSPLICDPVSVSTSGHTLLQADAVEVMINELFPLTTVITPNKSEAELLLSHRNFLSSIDSLETMLQGAKNLLTMGPQAVLLKGGHIVTSLEDVTQFAEAYPHIRIIRDGLLEANMKILQAYAEPTASPKLVADLLMTSSGETTLFVRAHIDSTSTHGTGCTLSAALACELARGTDSQLLLFLHTLSFG